MPPRWISALTTATMFDSRSSARASSTVRKIRRPARSPPACIAVRPPKTIATFLPSSSSTCWLPRRKPSPVAARMTTETTPHKMPNIVRKLRSLLARRFERTWWKISRMVRGRLCRSPPRRERRRRVQLPGKNHFVAGLEAAHDLDACPVADAHLDRHAAAAVARARVEDVHRRVALCVVDHGRFGHEQRVGKLLEDDLGVRSHV